MIDLIIKLVKICEKRVRELSETDRLTNNPNANYGESVGCFWSTDPDHQINPAELMYRWYAERKNYNYNAEPSNLNAGT